MAILVVSFLFVFGIPKRLSGAIYNSRLVTWSRLRDLASLEPIDVHVHLDGTGPAFALLLNDLRMNVLDILYVDDKSENRHAMEPQRHDALNLIASIGNRVKLCTSFTPFSFQDPAFTEDTIRALDQDFANGAIAVKIWKNIGMELQSAPGKYVMPDDAAFAPLYRNIAAHHKTLIAHIADPDEAWGRKDQYSNYYSLYPEWDMVKVEGAPRKADILQARDHVLAANPDLLVIGAHLGSLADHLDQLASLFDRYPNFAVDTSGRILHLMTQPRDEVRQFLIKNQDRILYGTDLYIPPGQEDRTTARAFRSKYLLDWRCYATSDRFTFHGHTVQGLNLPAVVLEKLYRKNAVHWLPGIVASAHSASQM